MPLRGTSTQRGYGARYRRARAGILGPTGNGLLDYDPPCAIGGPRCTGIATTADHFPPLQPGEFHLNLRPACKRCNCGHALPASAAPSRAW